jgi:hypothetical protein
MSAETKAAFDTMRFYKFYPVPSPDAPDVSNVKVGIWAFKHGPFFPPFLVEEIHWIKRWLCSQIEYFFLVPTLY